MKQNTSLRSDQIKIFMWIRNPTRYENTGEQTGWEIIYMDALFLWCIVTDEAFSIILVTIFDSIHYIYHQILEYYNMWSVIFYILNPWNEQGKCHEKVSLK